MDWERLRHRWPNAAYSRFVQAEGVRWHVQQAGTQGPRVLLLHGTGASLHTWRDILPGLAQRAQVLAVDLPGHAFSSLAPGDGMSLPGMARGLAGLLKTLNWQPDAWVGHSAGAAIAGFVANWLIPAFGWRSVFYFGGTVPLVNVPLLGAIFEGPPYGIGMFTAGLILAIMVLPFITSITRDVFETVPAMLKESAYGLGATTWEVMWNVVLPYTRSGVMGGIMLGLGRALGETMAVTFVIGNAHDIHASLLSPGTTISAALANEFTEATTDIYLSSLIALGLILFIITFSVLVLAKFMLLRLQRGQGT